MSDKISTPSSPRSLAPATRGWMQKLEQASGKTFERMRTVYLLLDCSGSMESDGKLIAAKTGAAGFGKDALAQGYLVGLIAFASTPGCMLEAHSDHSALQRALAGLTAAGSTDLAAAIDMVIPKLARFGTDRAICIVTDGMPDCRNAALQAAQRAKDRGIEILTLGTDDADQAFLAQLATRKDLALKVERKLLATAITSMARLLRG